jgi:hypothetical protein
MCDVCNVRNVHDVCDVCDVCFVCQYLSDLCAICACVSLLTHPGHLKHSALRSVIEVNSTVGAFVMIVGFDVVDVGESVRMVGLSV